MGRQACGVAALAEACLKLTLAVQIGERGQCGLQICRVPQHDGAHHDVHGAGSVGLSLETVVTQASDAVEGDGALRPTRKASYPLILFSDYMAWTTPDGAPFDPWVRKHHQLGARTVGIGTVP